MAHRNEKAETEKQGGTCRRRPGVTGPVVWRWREKEKKEAWSSLCVQATEECQGLLHASRKQLAKDQEIHIQIQSLYL